MELSFKEFKKSPVIAVLFLAILGLGYLYLANEKKSAESIARLEEDVAELKAEMKDLREEKDRLEKAFRDAIIAMKE